MVEHQFNHSIKILRSDNGGEYTNKALQTYLSQNGILQQLSCPYTPEQNRLAERKHRHILEVTRALILTANLPHNLWPDIMIVAVHIINLLPSPTLRNKTPHLLLYKTPPTYDHLKTIGCLCFPWLRPYSAGKLSPCSIPCVFLGYAQHHKGYKCYDPTTQHIYISRHVRFYESTFPFHQNTDTQPPPQAPPPAPLHPLILLPTPASTTLSVPLQTEKLSASPLPPQQLLHPRHPLFHSHSFQPATYNSHPHLIRLHLHPNPSTDPILC